MTKIQMLQLFFKSFVNLLNRSKQIRVSASNRIWANETLNFSPETFAPNEKTSRVPIGKVGFPQPGSDRINEEVNKTTHGMIPKLVDESDVEPRTALA